MRQFKRNNFCEKTHKKSKHPKFILILLSNENVKPSFMKHFFILPFLFLIFSASAFCQPNIKAEIDSLMKILPTTGQDTVREELYSELAFRWAQLNPDSTIFYLKEKLALSQKLKDEKRIIGNMIN